MLVFTSMFLESDFRNFIQRVYIGKFYWDRICVFWMVSLLETSAPLTAFLYVFPGRLRGGTIGPIIDLTVVVSFHTPWSHEIPPHQLRGTIPLKARAPFLGVRLTAVGPLMTSRDKRTRGKKGWVLSLFTSDWDHQGFINFICMSRQGRFRTTIAWVTRRRRAGTFFTPAAQSAVTPLKSDGVRD